jgi:peptide/nickel transport system substrate-binding protein
MLYWSSTLIEHDMKTVKQKLDTLESQILDVKSQMASRPSVVNPTSKNSPDAIATARPHIDPTLPNLLEPDPFYDVTLPEMLGMKFRPQGKIKAATIGKPENLHPFSPWGDVIGWIGLCNVSVATNKFGYYETFVPDMAIKMELRENKQGIPEYWIHLRDGVFYEPLSKDYFTEDIKMAPHFFNKHQVTSHDFKFYLDAIMNPYVQEASAIALRSYLADIEELRVIDDLTFIVRWKLEPYKDANGKETLRPKYLAKLWTGALKPLASFVYKYFPDGTKIVEDDSGENFYRTNSIWAQNFSQHFAKNIIVSCGAWIFNGMTDRQIQFRRNPNFYNPLAALTETRVYEFKQAMESIWQDFKSNNLDTYTIQPDQLVEYEKFIKSDQYKEQAEKGDSISRLDYVARRYVNLQWNQAKPFFQDKRVRQALTVSIDRKRIIKQNLNGMGIEINGPFFRYSKAYDESIKPWPFDPQLAMALLEEAGWYDSDGDGIIDKEINGKRIPFRFSLTYYVKNAAGKAIVEYIATALKEVGIDCIPNGVDIADLSATFEDKSFEAFFFIWGFGSPPEDPEQLWLSTLANVKGSSNAIGFQNKEADIIIKKLKMEYNEDERIKLYHEFAKIIHEEAPYTFLYSPKSSLLYRDYLQNVFIPADRQDILPGADIEEPDSSIYWIKKSHV